MYLFVIISYTTPLLIVYPHVVPVESGITNKLIPVRLNVIELDVVAKITKVPSDFNIVVIVLYF